MNVLTSVLSVDGAAAAAVSSSMDLCVYIVYITLKRLAHGKQVCNVMF